MIPEAEGTTPIGIFLLGDAFLEAARDTAGNRRKLTEGPTRLLSYHACELFLKAFLRQRGETVGQLRAYGHDLGAMLASATRHGLRPPPRLVALLERATKANDYVRVRYVAWETPRDIPTDMVLGLADLVRDTVRHALSLNEVGMPQGAAEAQRTQAP